MLSWPREVTGFTHVEGPRVAPGSLDVASQACMKEHPEGQGYETNPKKLQGGRSWAAVRGGP